MQKPTFFKSNLDSKDSRGQDLSGADFRYAKINNSRLTECDLQEADFRGSYINGADFMWANMARASLYECHLSNCNFVGAYLSGALLFDTKLTNNRFQGANLVAANLNGANLKGVDFNGANLQNADLRWADLRGADLSGAWIDGADFSDANLGGAKFPKNLSGQTLRFNGANLHSADFSDANLKGANLRDANFEGCNLKGADLTGADITGANLNFVGLSTTELGDNASKALIYRLNIRFYGVVYGTNIKAFLEVLNHQQGGHLSFDNNLVEFSFLLNEKEAQMLNEFGLFVDSWTENVKVQDKPLVCLDLLKRYSHKARVVEGYDQIDEVEVFDIDVDFIANEGEFLKEFLKTLD